MTGKKFRVSNFGAFKPLMRGLIYLKIHYHSHQTGLKGRIFFVGLLFTIPLAERTKGLLMQCYLHLGKIAFW